MTELTPEERLKKAKQASTFAFLAVLLCLMMNCGGCITIFFALPVSLFGLQSARVALDSDDPSDVVIAYATPARNICIATSIVSTLIIVLITLYILLYVGIIAAAVGLSANTP